MTFTKGQNKEKTTYYSETYRPQFHFTPEANWMNDPNGMVYYAGEYHLFYQYHPHGDTWGPMHWGHAVSKDMVHWEHLPIAFEPDELGMIFSGSAVVDWNDTTGFFNGKDGLVAMFTHANDGLQRQSIAYSKDKGRTWEKYEWNPVIENPGIKDFRDPKVLWHEETNKWVMVLAAGQKVMFYSSPNLKEWDFLSEFGLEDGAHGGVWECPDLFQLPVDGNHDNKRWVLQVDLGDGAIAGGSGGQYFIGEFDGITFTNENAPSEVLWVDYGKDFYAAQSFSDVSEEDGRRVWLAWMSNWKYANEVPTNPWRSAMSIPRQVELIENKKGQIKLIQKPVVELEGLRQKVKEIKNEVACAERNLLSDVQADVFELVAELEDVTATEFGLKVRKSTEGQETTIGYEVKSETLFVDRTHSGESDFSEEFSGRHSVQIAKKDGKLQLRMFVDRSSVEVFANEGEAVFTNLIFPDEESKGLELYVVGGEIRVHSLVIYPLTTTWR
ncbi:glycoside hydrolase family 32 protein [Halalkalibacter alkalisediminis]|uniref:Glycoside hydrolase family 32 protein n=1 Tax=Halalkalibacter alkalisediminis TaxID=935616 RepID=A0ABV6NEN7_9BACI